LYKQKQLTLGSLFDGIGGFPYAASFYRIRSLGEGDIVADMAHMGGITDVPERGDTP